HYDPREGFIYGRIIKPLFGRTLYIDMRRMEKIVMQSDRDWTILRPAQLVDSSAITNYRLQEGFMMAGSHKTARADLADGMLKQASSDQYLHKAIAIATFA
ncbi:MAG: NAD(P)H-binding protein, partial [Chloroflexales bacterium]